jgi:hypothetical protein
VTSDRLNLLFNKKAKAQLKKKTLTDYLNRVFLNTGQVYVNSILCHVLIAFVLTDILGYL